MKTNFKRMYKMVALTLILLIILPTGFVFANDQATRASSSVTVEYASGQTGVLPISDVFKIHLSLSVGTLEKDSGFRVDFQQANTLRFSKNSFKIDDQFQVEPDATGLQVKALKRWESGQISFLIPATYRDDVNSERTVNLGFTYQGATISTNLQVKKSDDVVPADELLQLTSLGFDDENTLSWMLHYNYNQLPLRGDAALPYILQMTLASGHELVPDSFTVYDLTTPVEGNRERGKHTGATNSPATQWLNQTVVKTVSGFKYENYDFDGMSGIDSASKAGAIAFKTKVTNASQEAFRADMFVQATLGMTAGGARDNRTQSSTKSLSRIPTGSGSKSQSSGDVELTVLDANNSTKVIPGAVYQIKNASNTVLHQNLKTDTNGKISVKSLAIGTYQFVQTAAPVGYIVNATPVSFEIKAYQTAPVSLTTTNQVADSLDVKTAVILKKVDGAQMSQPISGAKFNLVDSSFKVLFYNLSTDANGKIQTDGLKVGTYYFIETTAASGYILDISPIRFEIKTNQTAPVELTVRNFTNISQLTSAVVLTKVDATDNTILLPGAKFDLLDSKSNTIYRNLVTDNNGRIVLSNLTPGKYFFKEVEAPTGYLKDSNSIGFEIVSNQTKPLEITMKNRKGLEDYDGRTVIMKKVDTAATTTVLPGAVFTLLDVNAKELKTGLKTDASGLIIVEDLNPGTYYFVEKTAPTGYILDITRKQFVITEAQKAPTSVIIKNQKVGTANGGTGGTGGTAGTGRGVSPATGDESHLSLYLILFAFSFLALAGTILVRRLLFTSDKAK